MKKLILVCISFTMQAMQQRILSAQLDLVNDAFIEKVQLESTTCEELKQLIANGADLETQSADGETALFLAAYKGSLDVCRFLIEQGLTVDSQVTGERRQGSTALMAAITRGHIGMVTFLLDEGADASITNRLGNTALMVAIVEERDDLACFLLDRPGLNVTINAVNKERRSALSLALEKKHRALCKRLLERGADPHTPATCPALVDTCYYDAFDCIQNLLDHGALINYGDSRGRTALMVLAAKGQVELCGYLLDKGARLMSLADNRIDAMFEAVCYGQEKVVKLFLKKAPNPDQLLRRIYPKNRTLLLIACMKGFEHVALLLVSYGIHIHYADDYGVTPLHEAAAQGLFAVCEKLLEVGAQVTVQDNEGTIPLVSAVKKDRLEVCKLLLGQKHAMPKVGLPPILEAISSKSVNVATYFLRNMSRGIFETLRFKRAHGDVECISPFEHAVGTKDYNILRVVLVAQFYLPQVKEKTLFDSLLSGILGKHTAAQMVHMLGRLATHYKLPRGPLCIILSYLPDEQNALLIALSSRLRKKLSYPKEFIPLIASAAARYTIQRLTTYSREIYSPHFPGNKTLLEFMEPIRLLADIGPAMEAHIRDTLYAEHPDNHQNPKHT